MPQGKPDYEETARELRQRDQLLKFGLFASVFGGLIARRPATLIALATGYGLADRHRLVLNHQRALAAHQNHDGSFPKDPYPGFFSPEDKDKLQGLVDVGKQAYKESGLQEAIESFGKGRN